MYTKKEAFDEINRIQDYYVSELIEEIHNLNASYLKEINFTSATGTGKTIMMCKLIERMPDYFFIVTTLSRGHLNLQVKSSISKNCKTDNYVVYGLMDYRINSVLQTKDILNRIPEGKEIIWLRDEGHIKTNRFERLLEDKCFKVINFSATNQRSDIQCNFTQTMMLRTVEQKSGNVDEAINKLLEVKKAHKKVKGYNPCAIFRIVNRNDKEVERLCIKHKLKYINIIDEDFDISELCKDDNKYDVIINKMKIVEGIDIRRAHVLYMDSKPSNVSTTIQVIGRCRRNALLYSDKIDILAPENTELLKETRKCYVYYSNYDAKVPTDKNGEIQMAFCDYITCEDIKAGSVIDVQDGVLPNGLTVYELIGCSGKYTIVKDEKIGFNRPSVITDFYKDEIKYKDYDYIYRYDYKILKEDYKKIKRLTKGKKNCGYDKYSESNIQVEIEDDVKAYFKNKIDSLFSTDRFEYIKKNDLDNIADGSFSIDEIEKDVNNYMKSSECKKRIKQIYLNTNKNYIYNKTFTKDEKIVYVYSVIKNNIIQRDEVVKFKKLYCKYTKLNIKDTYKQLFFYLNTTYRKMITPDNILGELESFRINATYKDIPKVKKTDVDVFLETFDNYLKYISYAFVNSTTIIDNIRNYLNSVYEKICNNVIPEVVWDYSDYFSSFRLPLNEEDRLNSKYHPIINNEIFHSYYVKTNDIESALISTENFVTKDYEIWHENPAISEKVKFNSKLVKFIESKYANEIKEAQTQIFNGKNSFQIDKKCNKVIGYCVEYYSKYLLYGEDYLYGFLKTENPNKEQIIRACMEKYGYYVATTYGNGSTRNTNAFSEKKLGDYKEFVRICIELGEKTAAFVKEAMYKDHTPKNDHDPNLSIKHLAGLADYISEDVILDVKVKNHISITDVYQVLAYHYLSTKRSGLKISKLIIYDATSGKNVTIHLTNKNKVFWEHNM